MRRGREGGREGERGGRAGERGGGGREGEREREVCSDSYMDNLKSSDFHMRKEKFRLISGHFEKFGFISDKKKVRTHIWYI